MKGILVLLLCVSFCHTVKAQDDYTFSLLKKGSMPNSTAFLPDPAKPDEATFANDSVMYFQGKALRGTERGRIAREDAVTTVDFFMKRFSPAVGRDLSSNDYPALRNLITGTLNDTYKTIDQAKVKYARQRPCFYFKEDIDTTLVTASKEFKSYPSGHSLCGWSVALLLTTIFPEHAEDIIKTGYEIGESRVILGVHYASDVEAGRIAASAGYARLVGEKKFRKLLKKAKKELGIKE